MSFCFEIRSGEVDGIDVSGIPVVWTVNLPGNFTSGNGTARLYIDARATEEQRAVLDPLFHGKLGGAWQVLSGIVAKWLPTTYAAIAVEDGDRGAISVDGAGTINWETLTDHRGEKVILRNPPLLTPFSVRDFEVARGVGTSWQDPDMQPWEGVHAGRTTFAWSSEG